MTRKSRGDELLQMTLVCAALAAVSALGTPGCSSDGGGPVTPPKDTGNTKVDWYVIPKPDGTMDQWVPPKFDTGSTKADGATGDAKTGTDGAASDTGSTSCPNPTGASCSPACTTGQLCTPAKSGMCATEVSLSGPASNTAAKAAFAVAVLNCWDKLPSADTLCSTLNTCGMTGTMDENMLKNYVCSQSKATDFASATVHSKVKTAFGCGLTETYRPEWKITSVSAGVKGIVCFSYNVVSWWLDRIEINSCSQFPPK